MTTFERFQPSPLRVPGAIGRQPPLHAFPVRCLEGSVLKLRSSRLLQVAFEIDGLRIEFPIGDRFGIEPLDDHILDRVGEEMIPARIVVADEVLRHIVLVRQLALLEIAKLDQFMSKQAIFSLAR